MNEARTVQLQDLKAQVGRSEYHVDPDAVAEALILRVLDARAAHRRSSGGMVIADVAAESRRSGDVLEAG
jgi:hypothetical protein